MKNVYYLFYSNVHHSTVNNNLFCFILFQLYKIEREEVKKPSLVDRIFKQALREFKENLLATYSVANKQGNGQVLNIKYKDLIANFLHVKYLIV